MKTTHSLLAMAVLFAGTASPLLASDWPSFRGVHGGVSDDANLPTTISKDNVRWKVKLPGAGTSSPITWSGKIYLTCNADYGTQISKGFAGGFGKGGFGKGGFGKGGADTGEQKKLKLLVLCLDQKTGDILWQKTIQPKLPETPFSGMMREHSYASSTPITDGEKLFVFFGKSGVHAFDLDGKELWSADVGSATHMWGSAASPVLCKDVLIVNATIESKSIVGLDKNTGKELWRKSVSGNSWSSPVIVEHKDTCEVVMSLPGKIVAYEPKTGKELWYCDGIGTGGGAGGKGGGGFGGGFGGKGGGSYTASTPVVKDGIIYVIGGGGPTAAATSIAVKAGGKGNVNATHVLWRQKAGASSPSPVISGGQLIFVDGTVTSIGLADGKITYKERLHDARGEYVSAVAANDKVYALTRYNGLFVIAGGAKFEKLSHYDFPGDTSIFNASPAITDGRLFIRSNAYLYCIGKK